MDRRSRKMAARHLRLHRTRESLRCSPYHRNHLSENRNPSKVSRIRIPLLAEARSTHPHPALWTLSYRLLDQELRSDRHHRRLPCSTQYRPVPALGPTPIDLASPRQYPVRPGGSFDRPADAKKSGKKAGSAGGSPPAHAAMKETFKHSSGRASPCSSRSAIARSAKACTAVRASARVRP